MCRGSTPAAAPSPIPSVPRPRQATPDGAAPSGHVAAAPLAPAASVAASRAGRQPAPVASAAQPVGGKAAGWSAAGGTPIVVGSDENLDTLSRRYGVPASALLAANGLSSPAEVKGGTRIDRPGLQRRRPCGGVRTGCGDQERRRSLVQGRQEGRGGRLGRRSGNRRQGEEARGQGKGQGEGRGQGRRPTRQGGRPRSRSPTLRPRSRRPTQAKADAGKADASKTRTPSDGRQEAGHRRHADRQRRSEGGGREGSRDLRGSGRVRIEPGIPLAGARPNHPGLQGRRQRRHRHLGSGRQLRCARPRAAWWSIRATG